MNEGSYQNKLVNGETGLHLNELMTCLSMSIYDLLIYGVICAVGCLDFDSAHLTGSSTSCGLLTWCTVKIKSFLFNKQERCCYCHVAIIEMKLKLLLSEVYSSQSVIYNTDIHAYLVCHK